MLPSGILALDTQASLCWSLLAQDSGRDSITTALCGLPTINTCTYTRPSCIHFVSNRLLTEHDL